MEGTARGAAEDRKPERGGNRKTMQHSFTDLCDSVGRVAQPCLIEWRERHVCNALRHFETSTGNPRKELRSGTQNGDGGKS
ncbi:hypothetical protein GCM10019060_24270 [Novosphingobium pokkalii]|nr:hypothetical protein GCM10019060_24270 [Novosphingobium pokkalii]